MLLWRQNGQYSVANFCISNVIVQAPFVLLIAIFCSTPVFWMTDMNDDPARWATKRYREGVLNVVELEGMT